jgi:peroxiredoxin
MISSSAEEVRPLLVGSPIPNVSLVNSGDETCGLGELIRRQSAILIFYRGGW